MLLIAIITPAFGAASDLDARLEALRQADMRLATVAYRFARANDELCLKHAPLTGLVLQASANYDAAVRSDAIGYFHFESPIGIEGVVDGSPAASAGIRADDSLVAIDGSPLAAATKRDGALSALDADGIRPTTLTLRRDGRSFDVIVDPLSGCLAHAEVAVNDDRNAATDGTTIQVDSGLLNLIGNDDGALAAIVGHELSHIVLDHPQRLTAAHVDRGLFKGIGRSARLFRQTENEADRLSVTLMYNAGYDPQAAVRYWLTYGPQLNDHGGLGSTHLAWRDRAALIAQAVAAIPRDAKRPVVPDWITSRSQPLR